MEGGMEGERREGGGGPLEGLGPENPIKLTMCSVEAAAKFMNIKLPMSLFFYMALGLNDFDGSKSITRAIGRGGP